MTIYILPSILIAEGIRLGELSMEKNNAELLREIMPDTAKAFESLMSATFKDGGGVYEQYGKN